MPTRTDPLLARIQQIVDRHTQAKVARKTGIPPSSLSRYLQGRRVPADFCAKLAVAFGLNPSWLLLGEGASEAARITEPTARTAADLLELVTAMERITRSKLGALVDAEHGPLLLDLDRQLQRHAELRARLAERARPLLADLIERIDTANRAGKIEEAQQWIGAARQLEALVPGDDRLQLGLDRHAAYCAYRTGAREESLSLQRRALRRQLFAPDDREEALLHGTNLAITLRTLNRPDEATRIGRALLAIYEDGPREGEYARLEHQVGLSEVSIGKLQSGSARMVAAAPHLPEDQRAQLRIGLHEAWCWSGSVTLPDLARSEVGRLRDADAYTRAISASQMIRFALVTEEVEAVESWCDELAPLRNASTELLAMQCRALLDPSREALTEFERHVVDSDNPVATHTQAVDACQLALRAGAPRLARPRWRRAQDALESLPGGTRPGLSTRVVHARNTLACAPVSHPARRRAREDLDALRNEGYAIPGEDG